MYSNFGLIGTPLSHTLSPVIHNYFIQQNRINGGYCCFDIKPDELDNVLFLFKKYHFKGFNITLPYKETVLDYLDTVDEEAKTIKSVNTVKIKSGRLTGYNTDIYGIMDTFDFYSVSIHGKNILLLGAGGASKAMLYVLKKMGYGNLFLANRTVSRAKEIIKEFDMKNVTVLDIERLKYFDNSINYDIIINTTSAGITGEGSYLFDQLEGEVAFDMQYSLSGETYFLKKVKAGLKIDGLLMLIGQAYHAFKLWNEIEFEKSYKEILGSLRSRT